MSELKEVLKVIEQQLNDSINFNKDELRGAGWVLDALRNTKLYDKFSPSLQELLDAIKENIINILQTFENWDDEPDIDLPTIEMACQRVDAYIDDNLEHLIRSYYPEPKNVTELLEQVDKLESHSTKTHTGLILRTEAKDLIRSYLGVTAEQLIETYEKVTGRRATQVLITNLSLMADEINGGKK